MSQVRRSGTAPRFARRFVALVGGALVCGLSAQAAEPFPRPFHILAHRGASAYAPENTLESIRKALELGVLQVEIDVQLSKDDHVILFHDATLDKKTNASGTIRNHTRAQLEQVDIGSWFRREHPEIERDYSGARLVALDTVLAATGDRVSYHVELKSLDEELPRRTLEVIRAAGLSDRIALTSFYFEQLERARALDSEIPLALLIRSSERLRAGAATPLSRAGLEAAQKAEVDRARTIGCFLAALPLFELSESLVDYAHEHGMGMRAWRIKSDADMDRAIALGANGMTTNWPDRLIRRLLEYVSGRPLPEPEASS